MIKKNILTILTLMIPLTCNAITLNEQIQLKSELELVCQSYKTDCNVRYIDSYIPQAYTTYHGNIVFTTGLTNYLSYQELRAVGMHEVGHRVLKHYQKIDKFLDKWNFDLKVLQEFRNNGEYQADLFATLYFKQINQKNHLPEALIKLTAPDKLNVTTRTHPSTNSRINKIKTIENCCTKRSLLK